MSQHLKNKIQVLAIGIFIIVGMLNPLSATHIVGADMTFQCKGKEWFEISLTVRRDCFNGDEEALFDDPAFVGIYDARSGQNGAGQCRGYRK